MNIFNQMLAKGRMPDVFTSFHCFYEENGPYEGVCINQHSYNLARMCDQEKYMLFWSELEAKCAERGHSVESFYKIYLAYRASRDFLIGESGLEDKMIAQLKQKEEESALNYGLFVSQYALCTHPKRAEFAAGVMKEVSAVLSSESLRRDNTMDLKAMDTFKIISGIQDGRLSKIADTYINLTENNNSLQDIRKSTLLPVASNDFLDSFLAYELICIHSKPIRLILDAGMYRAGANGALEGILTVHRAMALSGRKSEILKALDPKENSQMPSDPKPASAFSPASLGETLEYVPTKASQGRLLYENNKMREFIKEKSKTKEPIGPNDLDSLIAELRPTKYVLHDHFRDRLNKRFGVKLTRTEVCDLENRSRAQQFSGCMKSGAFVKKIWLRGHHIYALFTHDREGDLTLTTAYAKAMLNDENYIPVKKMTPEEKDIYGVNRK